MNANGSNNLTAKWKNMIIESFGGKIKSDEKRGKTRASGNLVGEKKKLSNTD